MIQPLRQVVLEVVLGGRQAPPRGLLAAAKHPREPSPRSFLARLPVHPHSPSPLLMCAKPENEPSEDEKSQHPATTNQRGASSIVGLVLLLLIAGVYLKVTLDQLEWTQAQAMNYSAPADVRSMLDQLLESDPELAARVALEENQMSKRYHQGAVALVARTWVTYLGFMTGMLLALVGAALVVGRYREPTLSAEAKMVQVGMTLRGSSPGLILAVLGTVLMMSPLALQFGIKVGDKSNYFDTVWPRADKPRAADNNGAKKKGRKERPIGSTDKDKRKQIQDELEKERDSH